MTAKRTVAKLTIVFLMTVSAPGWAENAFGEPPGVREIMWVWGNPEMTVAGPHGADTFAEASPSQRAELLGVPNVILAGKGLPPDDAEAEALVSSVGTAKNLVLEIAPDEGPSSLPFQYTNTAARVCRLAEKHPNITGVLLDDMSTVAIDHGLKPEHIRAVREALSPVHARVKLWGVVYTMSLDRADMADYIRELDVINLWTWHARDVVDIEKNVAWCEERFPGKPIVLGLYLHDYGEGRQMPRDLLEKQCASALGLARSGRIQGMVFLTIDNDPEAVAWTADWIKREGSLPPESAADTTLRLGDGSDWLYSGEPWTETAEGMIRPPDRPNLHSRAFYKPQAFGDLDAEFEFNGDYRETGTGSAGLIVGASDAQHFHYLWFPWGGQQLRAKHFWAALATVGEDGWIRNVQMRWVPGVPSETDRWYKVRLKIEGTRIHAWVDGREALDVTDETYRGGAVGLAGYGWYAFRNVTLTETQTPPPSWDGSAAPPSHAIALAFTSEKMPSGCIAPNGDVLIAQGNRLVRSHDKGRTWEAPETLPELLGEITDYGSTMFRAGDRLWAMIYRTQQQLEKPVPEILMSESSDSGVTWSDPIPAQVAPEWPQQPKSLVPYGPLVQTAGGAWLRFLLGGATEESATFKDVRTWSATHAKAFAIRSTDQGKSWSAPIEIDQPSWVDKARGTIPGSLDLTEPTGVAMGDLVTVLVRPVYSPTMWQCWSKDGGATWDAAARTTFPGYAQSMIKTASGAILCAHRYPHYSVNISRDGGINWDAGTVIDYPVWAMGCMVEVEPDVVLCFYMNAQQKENLLAQLLRVTHEGIAPLKEKSDLARP
ncbi:MAG: hypothetical protein HY706_08720 [Candidatus Hydrogenedentes bacterium]|nr:hypothetical protein [Candidatus Hydrogenedentota bacterium]